MGQPAATVTITGSGSLAAAEAMNPGPLLAAPLAVTDFDVSFIQQQTSGPGFSNKISVTLSTSTVLPAAGQPQITICCLTGFTSPDSLFVSAPPELEQNSWDIVLGRLVLRVVGDLLAANSYSVSFYAVNSRIGQDSPSINVSVTQDSMMLISKPMDKGIDEQQPLLINEFFVSGLCFWPSFDLHNCRRTGECAYNHLRERVAGSEVCALLTHARFVTWQILRSRLHFRVL